MNIHKDQLIFYFAKQNKSKILIFVKYKKKSQILKKYVVIEPFPCLNIVTLLAWEFVRFGNYKQTE